jgi:hypothetical protein
MGVEKQRNSPGQIKIRKNTKETITRIVKTNHLRKSKMKSALLIILLNLIVFSYASGQCTIRGLVSDINGEAAIGAQIYLPSNKTIGTVSDYNGNYTLKINEKATQVIAVSYIGYKLIEDTLECINGAILVENYVLEPAATEIKEVTVTGKSARNTDAQMETYKKLSSHTIDFISSETIKKTGDANVGAAIARVTGVSTNSGGLITVRGAGDRYIKTTVNGSRIPTLDPFTNNIKLDIFPSSLIDNITIVKTAQPDLPGDWSSAYISVETKDYPEKLSVSVESSFGYNQQTTFKDVLSSQRSSTDWLGYDNSLREYDHNSFEQLVPKPTTYQEFVALGIGGYLDSLGISQNTAWKDEYTRLGLVRLHYLGKANIDIDKNDPIYQTAIANYDTVRASAYAKINANAIKSERAFPNNWNSTRRQAPLNFSQSFSIGNQSTLFGKPIGYLLGFRYSSSYQYDAYSRANKVIPTGIPENTDGFIPPHDSIFQESSKETHSWSALIKVAYKFNSNNSLSLLFMPNFIGVNNVRSGKIYNGDTDDDVAQQIYNTGTTVSQFYESRRQIIYQLKSNHYIPTLKTRLEFNASYTKGVSNAPDFKTARYASDLDSIKNRPVFADGGTAGAGRVFRYLNQNIFDSRFTAEVPIGSSPDKVRKIKFGGAFQTEARDRDQYFYQINNGDNPSSASMNAVHNAHPYADPLGLDRYEIDSLYHYVQQYYYLYDVPSNHILGRNMVTAGFAMVDYSISQILRFSGGVRVENAYMKTDCVKLDAYNLSPDDARRQFSVGTAIGSIWVQPGVLNQTSVLPSANLIIKLNHNETAPVSARLNYSKTVARPSLQELSDVAFYDYELKNNVRGNSNLKMVNVNNYDIRIESFFKRGDNISFSLFYKEFENHIDVLNAGSSIGYVYVNNKGKTLLKGIEIEGKKTITRFFEFRANITLIDSRSVPDSIYYDNTGNNFNTGKDGKTAYTMLGQAPYIVNGMVTYTSPKMGLTASLNYNVQGPRLVIMGTLNIPYDIYEMPRNLLDFKISKNLGDHFGVNFKIQDILNSPIVRSYKVGNTYTLEYDRYQYGTNYVLSVSYKL